MKSKIAIIIFLFFTVVSYSFGQQNKKAIKNYSLSYREYGLHIIDSLKTIKIDTIIAYNKYIVHSSENEEFDIVYIKNKVKHQITIIKSKKSAHDFLSILQDTSDFIYFDIVFSNEKQLLSLLDNTTLFDNVIKQSDNKLLVGGLPNHGVGYFFYIRIGDIEKSNDYCCGISLNEKMYKKAFPLWLLASAFNNYFFVEYH
ncbi:MAG: hypothetical protein IT237_11175 [Bacteroidia bacterium]|nr:hypothetical protein [Bacteroidia bacterium]